MIAMWMAAAPNYGRRREDAIASEDVEIDLGVMFDTACLQTGLTRKSAASVMGMDESQLSKVLRNVPGHDIGLKKILRLPPTFLAIFLLEILKAAHVAWSRRMWSRITSSKEQS